MSDTDDSFNFLISMCYTQLFNLLCDKADDVYGGRLPVHVRCLIDECANIGQIPNLEKLMATIRSREISASLVLQAQSQLKAIYKDNADTIIGNWILPSSWVVRADYPERAGGCAGEGNHRHLQHRREPWDGNLPSLNYQKLGKELMSQDELAVMDGGKCILQLRGVSPFLSDKYDITKHPNYKYTADADKKNTFDIEAFLSARLKLKPDEVCDVYEVDTKGAVIGSAEKGVIVSIRRNCLCWAIGVQSGQSQDKIMKKEDSRNHAPRKPGGRLFRLLYAYET